MCQSRCYALSLESTARGVLMNARFWRAAPLALLLPAAILGTPQFEVLSSNDEPDDVELFCNVENRSEYDTVAPPTDDDIVHLPRRNQVPPSRHAGVVSCTCDGPAGVLIRAARPSARGTRRTQGPRPHAV